MLLPLLSTAFCTDVTIANFINLNSAAIKKNDEFLGTALHDASYFIIKTISFGFTSIKININV